MKRQPTQLPTQQAKPAKRLKISARKSAVSTPSTTKKKASSATAKKKASSATTKKKATATTKNKITATTKKEAPAAEPKPKRPRAPRPKVTFYAVKSSRMIEGPIIFFELKDLKSFELYLQREDRSVGPRAPLAYEEFDNFLSAKKYIQYKPKTTEPTEEKATGKRKAPDTTSNSKKDASATSKEGGVKTKQAKTSKDGEKTATTTGDISIAAEKPATTGGSTSEKENSAKPTTGDGSSEKEKPALPQKESSSEEPRKTPQTDVDDDPRYPKRVMWQKGPRGRQMSWEEKFQLLVEFKQEYGHCRVPTKSGKIAKQKYKFLRRWGFDQRKALTNFKVDSENKEDLSPTDALLLERRKLLEDLGFEFFYTPTQDRVDRAAGKNAQYDSYIQEMTDFKKANGHMNVPHISTVRAFLYSQRNPYILANMPKTGDDQNFQPHFVKKHYRKLKKLKISMEEEFTMEDKRKGVQEYVSFVERNHRYPVENAPDPTEHRLARFGSVWAQERCLFEQGEQDRNLDSKPAAKKENGKDTENDKTGEPKTPPLTQDMIAQLDSVGFNWNQLPKKPAPPPPPKITGGATNVLRTWEAKFLAVKTYIEKYGMEPCVSHKTLGHFVGDQRKNYKAMLEGRKTYMTLDRFRMLTEIGFRFKVGSQRRYGFEGTDGEESSDDEKEEPEEDPFALDPHVDPAAIAAAVAMVPSPTNRRIAL